jgi:hypothetical protein
MKVTFSISFYDRLKGQSNEISHVSQAISIDMSSLKDVTVEFLDTFFSVVILNFI